MTSPIDPQMCLRTGRLLTEWFEYPVLTADDHRKAAILEFGASEDYKAVGPDQINDLPPDQRDIQRRIEGFVGARMRRTWKHNMTKQEVAMRMNEATKIASTVKFLDDVTRERTGLELNPLWQMEVLVRSGTLSPKEQISALKELATYTHSKAPTVTTNTHINANPEDWLLELAKDEYKVLGSDGAPLPHHMQPREKGDGVGFEKKQAKRLEEMTMLSGEASALREAIEAEFDIAYWIEPE